MEQKYEEITAENIYQIVGFRFKNEPPENVTINIPGMGKWNLAEALEEGFVEPINYKGNVIQYRTTKLLALYKIGKNHFGDEFNYEECKPRST